MANGALAGIFDGKWRAARRLGRERLRETRRLLRKYGEDLDHQVSSKVASAADKVQVALREGDPNTLLESSDRLGDLLEKHLHTERIKLRRDSWVSVAIAVAIALGLRAFVFEAFKIPSGSMIPTLEIGDQIFVNKTVYGVRIPFTTRRVIDIALPERGDVVVFINPHTGEDFIKRVIGLPGDVVELRDNVLYINGERVERRALGPESHSDLSMGGAWTTFRAMAYEETLGNASYTVLQIPGQGRDDYAPRRVPADHFFVMGDNRDNSADSRRDLGFVPVANLVGRAMFVWWSWGKDGLDTERLFTWIE